MIIKVLQERDNEKNSAKGVTVYGYEADNYVFLDDGMPENQCVVIFKDGKEIANFHNPIFYKIFVCNDNGKTIDTFQFSPINAVCDSEK